MSYGSHNPAALRRGRKGRALPTAPAPSRWSNLRSGRPITFALAFALVAIGSASAMGEGLLSAGVRAARDAVNVMEDRSPGERTHASLSKGKPRIDVGRVARALPRIRDARVSTQPPATAETLPGAVAAPHGGAVPGLAAPAATATPVALAEAPVGGFVGGPGGFFLPPFGGGGGGGGGGIIFVPPEEETPPAVPPETPGTPPTGTTPIPEPSMWAMMILGFAAAGAAARRRREAVHA